MSILRSKDNGFAHPCIKAVVEFMNTIRFQNSEYTQKILIVGLNEWKWQKSVPFHMPNLSRVQRERLSWRHLVIYLDNVGYLNVNAHCPPAWTKISTKLTIQMFAREARQSFVISNLHKFYYNCDCIKIFSTQKFLNFFRGKISSSFLSV